MSHSVKENLENTWLCVQIVAVFSAAIWAIFIWDTVGEEEIKPRFSIELSEHEANFFDDTNNSCSIGTHWTLTNTGSAPISVKDIAYSLYAVADDNAGPERDASIDVSVGRLISKGQLIARSGLFPSDDFATSGGMISRDIRAVYQPASLPAEHWFDTHRLVFVVTSVVDKYGKSAWCPFCENTQFETENVSRLQYVCSKNSSVPDTK